MEGYLGKWTHLARVDGDLRKPGQGMLCGRMAPRASQAHAAAGGWREVWRGRKPACCLVSRCSGATAPVAGDGAGISEGTPFSCRWWRMRRPSGVRARGGGFGVWLGLVVGHGGIRCSSKSPEPLIADNALPALFRPRKNLSGRRNLRYADRAHLRVVRRSIACLADRVNRGAERVVMRGASTDGAKLLFLPAVRGGSEETTQGDGMSLPKAAARQARCAREGAETADGLEDGRYGRVDRLSGPVEGRVRSTAPAGSGYTRHRSTQ